MSLNLKNPETLELVSTLARRRGVSQVQAITDAVSAQLVVLDRPRPDVDAVLAAIWGAQTTQEKRAVRERMAALYDEKGLLA